MLQRPLTYLEARHSAATLEHPWCRYPLTPTGLQTIFNAFHESTALFAVLIPGLFWVNVIAPDASRSLIERAGLPNYVKAEI